MCSSDRYDLSNIKIPPGTPSIGEGSKGIHSYNIKDFKDEQGNSTVPGFYSKITRKGKYAIKKLDAVDYARWRKQPRSE